ncbi:BofC N-terminal domain-containing protein [Jeotgalibacillus terrae]|uniref:BofC N-terminal domain-containing protein n=1 Tax=Jeotgalibacillus terrae TaxID=587735 RepID=A0ABW5ZHP2_9BACL|nr:BofC N-terminal domain-containing protein [Jeotgalibacillus terrae]MBM7578812.1 forespore regulator of the sigma-K checkpoint [Jeotgalibacillus terrae]
MVKTLFILFIFTLSACFTTQASALTLTLSIETVYGDGEKSFEKRKESYEAMEDFFSQYRDWQIIDMNKEEITLRTRTEKLSPLLEWSGYAEVQ